MTPNSSTAQIAVMSKVDIDTRRFPFLNVEFFTTPNTMVRMVVASADGTRADAFAKPNQVTIESQSVDLRQFSMKKISEVWFFVNQFRTNSPPEELRFYLTKISVFHKIATLSWDDFLVASLIGALVAPSIVFQLDVKRKDSIDKNLPNLLRDIAEAGRTGMTLTKAIEVSAERNYGPLTDELRLLIAQLSWKQPLADAFQSFADRADTMLSRRAALLVTEAAKSGGDIQKSLETISNHISELQGLAAKRKSSMRPYVGVIYIAFAVFLSTVWILLTQFFATISEVGTLGLISGAESVPIEAFTAIFLYMSVVEAFFVGLVGGKMGTGSMKNGLKHALILTIFCFVVFNFLV